MYMTDQQRLAEARALASSLDKLTRNPKRITPSAPWIIPATMIVVAVFAFVCFVIKLLMHYLNRKHDTTNKFSGASSPDIPTTPEDQASMATTASMKTRGSLRNMEKRRRNKPPPVSLYQLKHKQSPGSSTTKAKQKAAMKAISRAAKAEANRSLSRDSTRQIDENSDDDTNDGADNSPANLSDNSQDIDDVQETINQSNLAYSAAVSGADLHSPNLMSSHGAGQPELHTVEIRDIEDAERHSQPVPAPWPGTESEI